MSIEGAAVASYSNDSSDRITTQNESSFSYDGNSDLTSDGTRTYTYDQEGDGRVLTASANGLTASYRGACPLAGAAGPGEHVRAAVFEDGDRHHHGVRPRQFRKIAAEYDGSGNVQRDYAYLPHDAGPVVSLEAGGNINYRQYDRLGTLVALSGGAPGAGALITNWYAQPDYGSTNLLTAGVTFGYAGYYFDQETGLYKTASRYYDPRLGRFLSPDPIRQDGGLNIYAYAGNDPLNLTDTSGLCTQIGCGNANPNTQLIPASTATGSSSVPAQLARPSDIPSAQQFAARSPRLFCQNVECGAPTGGTTAPRVRIVPRSY